MAQIVRNIVRLCPNHMQPDCSPLLNGCAMITAPPPTAPIMYQMRVDGVFTAGDMRELLRFTDAPDHAFLLVDRGSSGYVVTITR